MLVKAQGNSIGAVMQEILRRLGIEDVNPGAWAGQAIAGTTGEVVTSYSPGNGEALASIQLAGVAEYEKVVEAAQSAFERWRMLPAVPKRGEIVRQMGDAMREHKDDLGALVTLEVGKILSEGLGEVQESIDMVDLAVGMSRQLFGLSMHRSGPAIGCTSSGIHWVSSAASPPSTSPTQSGLGMRWSPWSRGTR